MTTSDFFSTILDAALSEVAEAALPVYTFALYHDHESEAVSVCVDTEESSERAVASMNRFSMRYFAKAIEQGDLKDASLWQANAGRSFSLGDFALVNAARTSLGQQTVNESFYLTMVRSLMAVQERVAALSPNPQHLRFACSGADSEVAYVWSLPDDPTCTTLPSST